MKKKSFLVVSTIVFLLTNGVATIGFANENHARLQFVPNTSVDLKMETTRNDVSSFLEKSNGSTGSSITNVQDRLTGTYTVSTAVDSSEKSGLLITKPPFDFDFTIKSYSFQFCMKNKDGNPGNVVEDSFDTAVDNQSIQTNPLARFFNRAKDLPMKIGILSDFKIEKKDDNLKKLLKEFPVSNPFNPKIEKLLVDLFFYQVALMGEELVVGKKIVRNFPGTAESSSASRVEFIITNIDDYSVFADYQLIKGGPEKPGSQTENLGKIKWNRDNAMLYEMEVEVTNLRKTTIGDIESIIEGKTVLKIQTNLSVVNPVKS